LQISIFWLFSHGYLLVILVSDLGSLKLESMLLQLPIVLIFCGIKVCLILHLVYQSSVVAKSLKSKLLGASPIDDLNRPR